MRSSKWECPPDAIHRNPNNAKAHGNRGNALEAKGDYDGAIEEYGEVIRINRQTKTVVVHDKAKDTQYEQPYDVLILSPGAEPVRPPIPGADHKRVFTLRSLADMDAIKTVVDAGAIKSAVVVGGGYIGLEMTEVLVHRGLAVSLVELERLWGEADLESVGDARARPLP